MLFITANEETAIMKHNFFLVTILLSTQLLGLSGERCLNAYKDHIQKHEYYIPGTESVSAAKDVVDCFKDHSSYIDLGILLAPWMIAKAPLQAAVGLAKTVWLPADFALHQKDKIKYWNMLNFMSDLDTLSKNLVVNAITKNWFLEIMANMSLDEFPDYTKFTQSPLFLTFRAGRPENDRELVAGLLFEYLHGTLLCGEGFGEFSPLKFKTFKQQFQLCIYMEEVD